MAKIITTEAFIESCKQTHKDYYDYSLTTYTGIDNKITIICPVHGQFEQQAYNHRSGKGCSLCGTIRSAAHKQKDLSSFIIKARTIHGDKYDYSKSVYTSAKEKITITCPAHGDFEQLVSGHLSGYGCKHCASHGKGRVDFSKPCTLYYLHLKDFDFYKIGITTLSIDHRYRTAFDKEQFNVVFTKTFPTGKEAYELEQTLLQKYSHLKHTGAKLLKTGNTEIFTEDIFKGDYSAFTN